MSEFAIDVVVNDAPGVLNEITKDIYEAGGNIKHVGTGDRRNEKLKLYFELIGVKKEKELLKKIQQNPNVLKAGAVPTFTEIYGKRIIIIGGGAQVSEVAKGAISEADRHNIRGESISVDTIPLTGEDNIEKAVRAVSRLSRVQALVLAGSLMGGKVSEAVKDVRKDGVIVVSLNMAGSVPDAADLVVTDPIQAGVMTVMAISDNAKFSIEKQRGKKY